MARLTAENTQRAKDTIGLYPQPRSAMIPLLHLCQEQDGYLTDEAMAHVAELIGVTPAEVRGTATFYDMFFEHPVGKHLISVCTNIACLLGGGVELLEHAEQRLGIKAGGTTTDGEFTLEEVECIALCDKAPCLTVNWRFFASVSEHDFDQLVEDLQAGRHAASIPPHGTLVRIRREGGLRVSATQIAEERTAMAAAIKSRKEAADAGGEAVITDAPRIVTSRLVYEDSHTLHRYTQTGGYDALRKAVTSMTPEEVTEEVTIANLLGRGGAGFEAGRKWSMLRQAPTKYLVINGDESEPATFKDHMLIERDPHQIVEGTLITAYAIQATLAIIYCRGEFALGIERLTEAVNEAYRYGAAGNDIFGSGFSVDVIIHYGAGAYICGDETGLLESLEGKRGFPRIKPPYFPAVMGLYNEPTIVNNVETMSNIPWIVNHGGAAFKALGEGRSTGTRIFALAGKVNKPGNFEVEMAKTTFRDLIYAPVYGGGIPGGREFKAMIPGGASSPWLGPEHLDVGLGDDAPKQGIMGGTMLGSGSIVVFDDQTCMVRAAWRVSRFFARESCGQCTPCREGSGWIDKIMYRIEQGAGRPDDLDLLLDLCDNIAPGTSWPPQQTTICPLGPSIPSAVVSSIRMFRDEYLVHIKEGACPFHA